MSENKEPQKLLTFRIPGQQGEFNAVLFHTLPDGKFGVIGLNEETIRKLFPTAEFLTEKTNAKAAKAGN